MFEDEAFASSGAAIRHREQGMAPQAARHQCKRVAKPVIVVIEGG